MLGPADPGRCWIRTVQRPETQLQMQASRWPARAQGWCLKREPHWGPAGLTPQAGWAQDTLPWAGPCQGSVTEAGLVGRQHPCLALSEHMS